MSLCFFVLFLPNHLEVHAHDPPPTPRILVLQIADRNVVNSDLLRFWGAAKIFMPEVPKYILSRVFGPLDG